MEDELLFKCHVHQKKGIPDEIRRFAIEQSKAKSFDFLNQKLQSIMPGLTKTKCTITWKDPEGDEVVISTDEELKIAVVTQVPDLVRLHIYCEDADVSVTPDTAANNSNSHYGVVCDGCDKGVCGFRYKCTTCDDYDLCSKCEAAGLHPEHCMVRVPTPNMPRMTIRAAVKRSRHFLKTVATAVEEERCKKRREPSSERKRRGDHGHGHGHYHGHGHRQHSSDHEHHRRQRNSWLETFATYMNEFANLAGDVNIEIDKSEPNQTQTQSTQSPKEPSSSTTNEQPHCPYMPANFDVNNVQKILNMYFGGLDSTEPTSKNAENSNVSQPKNNDVEMGQGDRKSPETDKASLKSDRDSPKSDESLKSDKESLKSDKESLKSDKESLKSDKEILKSDRESLKSDKESFKSDKESLKSDKESLKSEVSSVTESESENNENPDKIDDWTVINKERDLMDSDEKPNDPTPPIGFNLPKEFQERVNISGESLYPPLNEATAVLKPKEPEVKTAAAETSTDKPEPSAPPTEKPKDEPRKRHPLRHIDAAIDQMMAMGFTNDGGWLTQILESKNGNIAAVLDLLTPVNPKK